MPDDAASTEATGTGGSTDTGAPSGSRAAPAWWRTELRSWLELLALSGFAITQPVLDVFGKSPESFVAAGASRVDIVVFALVVTLVPGTVLEVAAALTRLAGPTVRRWTQSLLVGGLVVLVATHVVKDVVHVRARTVAITAVVVGTLAALAYLRFAVVRLYLLYGSAAPALFLAAFLFVSPASGLVLPKGASLASVSVGPDAPSVVMIVLDELPIESLLDGDGHVDAQLFPDIARLAATSTWYRDDTTVGPYTNLAVPAMLTGTLPEKIEPPTAGAHPHSLFTLLGGSYDLDVHEVVTHVCPADLCGARAAHTEAPLRSLLRQSRHVWHQEVSPHRTTAPIGFDLLAGLDPDRGPRYEQSIASITPAAGRPHLDFFHFELPHAPWIYLPDGKANEVPDVATGLLLQSWATAHAAAIGRQRHLLQLQYADHLVGEVLDRLRATGRLEHSLVVLTADHGVSFQSGEPYRGVSKKNFDEIMWTPLFVKLPGQHDARTTDRNVESIDILPTIADTLGIRLPWKVDGTSMLGSRRRAPADKQVRDWEVNTLHPRQGSFVHVDGREGFRRVYSKPDPVPPGPADLRVYRQGSYAALVGTRPGDHDAGPPTSYRAALDDRAAFAHVDTSASRLPAYTSGHLVGTDATPKLAIAINGRIGGWSPADEIFGLPHAVFYSLLPEQYLRSGTNQITLYEIDGPPGRVTLRPVPLVG